MKLKYLIAIIILLSINSLKAEGVNLNNTRVDYYRKNNLLFYNLIDKSPYKKSKKTEDKINNRLVSTLKSSREINFYRDKTYKEIKKKESQQLTGEEKDKKLKPLIIDTIVKGTYKNIVKGYKEKLGKDRGNQYLTQKARNYFTFKLEIIDKKSGSLINEINIKAAGKNINPALKKMSAFLIENIKQIKEQRYFYPINRIYSANLIIPVGDYTEIATGGFALNFSMDVQNYPLPYMLVGFDTYIARIISNSDKIDSYNQLKINASAGFRIPFSQKYFLSIKLGTGYLLHNINNNFYADPNLSLTIENSIKYRDDTYIYMAPSYNVFFENDSRGKFISFNCGINKLFATW